MLHLKEYLPDVEQGLALDVGTRMGEFALTLAEVMPQGSRVIGLDCDEKAVAQAREKHADKGVEFAVGNAEHLDYPDGSFALVAISNTLHHIERYDAVLEEMLRVLKPGGYFLINEMFSDGQNQAQQTHFAQHSLEAELDMLSGEFQRPTWTKGELLEILGRLPLRDVRTAELLEESKMDAKLAEKTAKLTQAVEKKAAGTPRYTELLSRAREIQARYEKTGIQRCTQLVYIGKKA